MSEKIDSPLKLHNFLPYRLSVLSNRVSQAIADKYNQRFDLSLPEWRIMAVLGEFPDISAGEVAEKTAMDKVAVSRAVSKLLDKGNIERHFAEDDKRRSVLALSETGISIYNEIVPIAVGYEDLILDHLSDDERVLLRNLFDRLDQIQLQI
ncbi:MarR family transcriptional regulator [Kordiimonas sediminis]|uniref:MarR family transcriptional regulator n=1 Tax=Kordiimonas sediminis TaxID=1735581 RepID=A0A919E9T2_9PROT|nr:MarR family winged helix-turn-helix transcriptional regulator [Kordiimonas sediminis]GHF26874.1 MarR family transcriptional regulator [Kordiimonas sediminis]